MRKLFNFVTDNLSNAAKCSNNNNSNNKSDGNEDNDVFWSKKEIERSHLTFSASSFLINKLRLKTRFVQFGKPKANIFYANDLKANLMRPYFFRFPK